MDVVVHMTILNKTTDVSNQHKYNYQFGSKTIVLFVINWFVNLICTIKLIATIFPHHFSRERTFLLLFYLTFFCCCNIPTMYYIKHKSTMAKQFSITIMMFCCCCCCCCVLLLKNCRALLFLIPFYASIVVTSGAQIMGNYLYYFFSITFPPIHPMGFFFSLSFLFCLGFHWVLL